MDAKPNHFTRTNQMTHATLKQALWDFRDQLALGQEYLLSLFLVSQHHGIPSAALHRAHKHY